MADDLLQAAKEARERSYSPYSDYAVGAALRDEQGRIHTGCNVENISYGATICAERSAVMRMISEGGKSLSEVVVVTRDGGTPCGMCLQVLAEFASDPSEVRVRTVAESGQERFYTLEELLPHGFRSSEVNRTKHI